eukprot:1168660-Rhodomonas_salina.3
MKRQDRKFAFLVVFEGRGTLHHRRKAFHLNADSLASTPAPRAAFAAEIARGAKQENDNDNATRPQTTASQQSAMDRTL